MTISSESINQAVSAVSEAGSIADAANTLANSGADPGVVATVGAVAAIAGAGTNPATGAGAFLGTIGIVAETYNSIVEGSDGDFSWDDIGAAAGLIGAILMRAPGGQAAGAYFLLFSLTYQHLNDAGHWIGQNAPLPHEINDLLNRALNWILPRDPLALDLDGDGIETLPANGTVLFDHDGDGTKNGTGWIAPDDGILVLDRNGNGLIDNGGELFGDNTIKIDGTRALDGFDALADIDSNGDGLIDTNDGVFSQLRIWRDANSDGKVQNIRRAA